jgi:hypothetical protein
MGHDARDGAEPAAPEPTAVLLEEAAAVPDSFEPRLPWIQAPTI